MRRERLRHDGEHHGCAHQPRGHENGQHHVHRCRLHRGRVNHVVREQPRDEEEERRPHPMGQPHTGAKNSAPRFTWGNPRETSPSAICSSVNGSPMSPVFPFVDRRHVGWPLRALAVISNPALSLAGRPIQVPVSFNKTISILVFQSSGKNATSTLKWSIFRQHTRVFSTISPFNWHLACHFWGRSAFTAKKEGSMRNGVWLLVAQRALADELRALHLLDVPLHELLQGLQEHYRPKSAAGMRNRASAPICTQKSLP